MPSRHLTCGSGHGSSVFACRCHQHKNRAFTPCISYDIDLAAFSIQGICLDHTYEDHQTQCSSHEASMTVASIPSAQREDCSKLSTLLRRSRCAYITQEKNCICTTPDLLSITTARRESCTFAYISALVNFSLITRISFAARHNGNWGQIKGRSCPCRGEARHLTFAGQSTRSFIILQAHGPMWHANSQL